MEYVFFKKKKSCMYCDKLATVQRKRKHSVCYEQKHNIQFANPVVHATAPWDGGLSAVIQGLTGTCGCRWRGEPRVESAYHLKRMQRFHFCCRNLKEALVFLQNCSLPLKVNIWVGQPTKQDTNDWLKYGNNTLVWLYKRKRGCQKIPC